MKTDSKLYLFQTGHGKGLAKAEIQSLGFVIIDEVEDGFIIETNPESPTPKLSRMGGIVRITEVLQSGPAAMPLNFEEWVSRALESYFSGYKRKMRFGLSMHPKNEKTLRSILNGAKKNLKKLGNLRFVNKDFQNLSSVQAWHEHLLEPGAVELHLFKSETKWYLSQTLAIQDFEWYSHRDFNRPAKDAQNGMFPPKLAQILINLAQPMPGSTLFDPFCGSGTVLQEAVLMGFSALGSDLENVQVEDARKNLDWLTRKKYAPKNLNFKLFTADATLLKPTDLPTEPFAIVSETTLGPRLTKLPAPDELKKIQTDIETLLDQFLANLKKIIKNPVTLVFTVPFHKEKNDRHFLPRLPEILARHAEIISLSDHERPSLFYERKDQTVGREIWKVLIK